MTLKLICSSDLTKLMNVLEKKLPHSVQIYHWLRIHQIWERKIPGMKLEVLCPRGDWSSGTVVALCRGLMSVEKFYMVPFADSDHVDEISEALDDTSLVPWSNLAYVTANSPIDEVIRQILYRKIEKKPREYPYHFFFLPREKAAKLNVTIPAGARVDRIEDRHLPFLCRLWKPFTESYRPIMQAIVKHNLSAGVFLGDELVSTALESEYGGPGMGLTELSHQNKGYSLVVVSHLLRDLGQAGHDIHSSVLFENAASLRLHQKAGFGEPIGVNTFFDFINS